MKKILLIFTIFAFVSCSDDTNSTVSKLIGTWNWVESTGGIAGITETPESTGKNIKIEFSSSTFKKYINGVLEVETSYTIEMGASIRSTEEVELIIYTNDTKQSFIVTANQLTLFDECFDCFTSIYTRD